jgi:hypothetical protein
LCYPRIPASAGMTEEKDPSYIRSRKARVFRRTRYQLKENREMEVSTGGQKI